MKRKVMLFFVMMLASISISACGKISEEYSSASEVTNNKNSGVYSEPSEVPDNSQQDQSEPSEASDNNSQQDQMEPHMSIDYRYGMFLNTEAGTRIFETEQDGVNYSMISWGRYLRVVITNNRSDSVRIGGEYKLQRMIDGNFVDIDDTVNICYGGTYVSEMPVIKVTYEDDGNEIVVDNNEFTIDPGQTIEAQFITMQYVIDDSPESDGKYRFIYGDAVIDFELICREIS